MTGVLREPKAVTVIRVVSTSGGGWDADGTRLGVRSLGEGRRDERIGAGRVRLGWAKQAQMGSDRCEGGRGHADYASELIGGFEWRTRRSVIEPCCAIVREHHALRSGDGGGAGPFADRVCETTRALGIAAGGAEQRFEERGRSRILD